MELIIQTSKREEIVDITQDVKGIVKKEGKKDGVCLVYVPHATCSIIVNENYDEAVCRDIFGYAQNSEAKTTHFSVWLSHFGTS